MVTPDALASPRVGDEWQGIVDSCRNWSHGKLVPVMLVGLPFRSKPSSSAGTTTIATASPCGAWAAHSSTCHLDVVSTCRRGYAIPTPPMTDLADGSREELIVWLVPELRDIAGREALARILGRTVPEPRDYGGVAPAASALLVEMVQAGGGKGAADLVCTLLAGSTIVTGPARRRDLERLQHKLSSP